MQTSGFGVEQQSTYVGKGLWDWSVWLTATGATTSLEEVKWVSYSLHPCYPNPNRVIRKRANGFRLDMRSEIAEEATWGTFAVRVIIALQNGMREKHTLQLNLRTPDGREAARLLPIAESADYAECKRIYKLLKNKSAFGYAREVLEKAERLPGADTASERVWLAQQKALCTYKDPSLPNDTRLQQALEILRGDPCRLSHIGCSDPETLGLGGAIYKRLWELDRSYRSLESSLAYYRRGYEQMLRRPQASNYDGGAFAGTNLSYLCELMALELGADTEPQAQQHFLEEAQAVRRTLVANLTRLQDERSNPRDELDWWLPASLLEAYTALASTEIEFEPYALEQANIVAAQQPSAWQRQSTGQQLLRTLRLHQHLWPERAADLDRLFKRIIKIAFGDTINLTGPMFDGKLGLALSGGGFRASLYHIGMLARLAELDLLRHVEVISCVSGGSIVGAHYYLLLRELLQRKADSDIQRADYLALIDKLLDQFLAGVQKNVRMRVAASWAANVRMIFQPSSYSRTQRLGELYEEHLYKLIEDGEQNQERWLNETFITPKKADEGWEDCFSPKLDNWHRSNKVPMLVLNATSLNTGRNWQFTASWMGEPLSYGTGIDATERLEPVYYSEAPEALQRMRLGHAVAASSCVPALFTPMVINGLYPDRTVRLVDGGVHDNQGARALLDQDCSTLLVSDASGQMLSQSNPPHGELGVFGRTNSVLQARIRIAQYQELQARERFGLIKQLTFLHLRKRIESAVVGATGTQGADADRDRTGAAQTTCTEYGVHMHMQSALAGLRTDLDSFTDIEALALMYSGYAMTDKYLQPMPGTIDVRVPWRFLDVKEVAGGEDTPHLSFAKALKHVRVGKDIAFKVWQLHPALKVTGVALLLLLSGGLIWGLWILAQAQPPALWNLSKAARSVLVIGGTALLAALLPAARKLITGTRQIMQPAAFAARIVAGLGMALAGSWLCKLHVRTFDRLFLKLGSVPKSTRLPSREATVVLDDPEVSYKSQTAAASESTRRRVETLDRDRDVDTHNDKVAEYSEPFSDLRVDLERDLPIHEPLELKILEDEAIAAGEPDLRTLERAAVDVPVLSPQPRLPAPATLSTEDKVQFTVRHPKELRPNDWQKLLAYMHLASAVAAVRENARVRLGASIAATGDVRGQATLLVARGVEITVVPELRGCRFNPRQASFTWLKDWHCAEFEVQADPGEQGYELGAIASGLVQFYVGPLLIGTVPIWSDITMQTSLPEELEEQSRDPYQKIFPSYSHQDTELVEQMEKVYEAVGLQYLRDVQVLRSGEDWNPALLRKIDEADIFQLFWSQAASQSSYVKQEWEHALKRGEPNFIRPMYWVRPMPIPPEQLQKIHFSYYESGR